MYKLIDLKNHINQQKNKSTLISYFYALEKLVENTKSLNSENIENYLNEYCKNKKDVSKAKNGLKLFCKFNKINFNPVPFDKKIEEKPIFSKSPEETFKAATIFRKINSIKNKKLKIAYKLMINGGLRVSEVSNLKKENIEITEDGLLIHVVNSKFSKDRSLYTLDDEYLVNGLKDLLANDDKKLFYSSNYMQVNAEKLGFHTHDLRKCYAQIIYYNTPSKNATEKLRQLLGHQENSKTYFKYINREINFTSTKYNKMKPF